MSDSTGIPLINEGGDDCLGEPKAAIQRPEKNGSSIGTHGFSVELDVDSFAQNLRKMDGVRGDLSAHGRGSFLRIRFPIEAVQSVSHTPDPTHGQQELTFFDGHDDTYCYKPLVVSVSFDQDPEQYLVGLRLRPGKAKDDRALVPLLRRLVSKLRCAFSSARTRVWADAGFGKSPRFLDALDALQVEYALGYQPLQTLQDLAEPVKEEARTLHQQGLTGEDTQVFGEFVWQPKSGTWPRERRIVVKAEVTHTEGREPRLNVRFVVTRSMGRFSPRGLYRVYRQRGDSET